MMDSYVERLYKSAPAVSFCSYTYEEFNAIGKFNLMLLSKKLDEVKEGLRDDTVLETEIHMIKVMIYRVQAVLRNDKHLESLTKVRRCVRKLVGMEVPETVEKLNKKLKAAFEPNNVMLKGDSRKNGVIRLPSRQMFESVQVQIQAMTLLIVHTLKAICTAHECGLQKFYLGHFIPVNVILSSTLARLWVLLKAYLLKCVELYQTMLPLTRVLKGDPTEWFPSTEQFPVDLSEWLGINSLKEIKSDS